MNGSAIVFALITAVGVVGALVAARADECVWYAVAKIAASAGFVGVGLAVGALHAIGFTVRGMSLPAAAAAAVVATTVGSIGWVALRPRVPAALRIPVSAYIAITTIMLAAGIATGVTRHAWSLVAGVVLVALSDGAVGAERFGTKSFAIKAVGLPAYYLGQALIAVSLAG